MLCFSYNSDCEVVLNKVVFPLDQPRCTVHEFRCGNGKCVDNQRKCDGNDDCGDSSDETNCGK